MNNCYGCGNPYQNPYGSSYSARNPCRHHFPSVMSNFYAPAVGTPIEIEVTDTTSLYVGQGVKIGSGYYMVRDILTAVTIQIENGGLGITPGTLVVAREARVACYQFPVIPVGAVMIPYSPNVEGYEIDTVTPIPNSVTINSGEVAFGLVGPQTVRISFDMELALAEDIYHVGVSLPAGFPRNISREPIFLHHFNDGGLMTVGVGHAGTGATVDYMMLVKSGGTQFTSATISVKAAGVYEIQV